MDMYKGGSCMTNNDQPEVIDPNDPRYKDDDYFKHSPSEHQRSRFEQDRKIKYYSFGCTPFGCGCLPVVAIIALVITWLISFIS